jgi:hypothetical protein
MKNRLVLVLCVVAALIVLFTLFGFLLTPYFIGKFSVLALPAFTFSQGIPIWLLRIIFEFQKFFNLAIAIVLIFGHIIFLYVASTAIVLGLGSSKFLNWFAISTYSYGMGMLVLLSGISNMLKLDLSLAIATIPLGITTAGVTKLFWIQGFRRIYSALTVLIAVILGNFLGVFVLAAITELQTPGRNGIRWTTLLFPVFLLQLCLALSIKKQLQPKNS